MSEKQLSFDENELSEDDLAVLRAFEAMDDEQLQSSSSITTPLSDRKQQASTEFSFEDMLLVFVSEVDEDITALQRALNQLEHETSIQPGRFEVFRRHGHKIHGSAGFVEYHSIVKIAQHIEDIATQALNSALSPETSVKALQYAVVALEKIFQQVIATGKEDDAPLMQLEGKLSSLSIYKEGEDKSIELMPVDGEDLPLLSNISSSTASTTSYMRVDASRFEDLLRHSEQLGELSTPLTSALEQVEKALQELSSAQSRMAKLESMHFALLTASQSLLFMEELPTSSLMARILSKARQGADSSHVSYKDKSKTHVHTFKSSSSVWDELDVERYSEQDLLLNSIREVISEVNIASTHVRIAFAHLHVMLQEYTNQANIVHSDTLILRLVPLSILTPRLQEALAANNSDQGQHIEFEVVGDETEIDQQILAALSVPLIQLLATCHVDTSSGGHKDELARVWLHAQETGNTITIEIGFSVTASGGAVDPLRETIQRLDGTFSLQRNASGGASFHLRLPRSQGTIRCLLIRVDDQQVIVPFSQVQRIGDSKREKFDTLYRLHDLLACPTTLEVSNRIQPVLVLLQRTSPYSVGVIVDEVMDEVELVVKPLPSYLQRPGITNAGIDGKGRVLLMADLPELVRHYTQLRYNANNKNPVKTEVISPIRQTPPKILLADDSVALRNTLVHMLKHANYGVLEARDGLEALEQLVQHVPDVFLLDVEMPNLNGYDLLGIMHLYPSLASVKIIMLTSRSSEKHIQHAMDLGAHAYLTKPCSQETLMETIQKMLQS